MSHPTKRLDPAIHQPARLGILSAACDAKRIDFVTLRDLLDLTDGNLSRHLGTLEAAGYIKIEKTFDKKKPRTWISATKAGRAALANEIDALREIVAAAEPDAGRARSGARRPRPATG